MDITLISSQAESNPEKPAIIMASTGQVTTFAEFAARTNQIANYFHELGLCPGDRVAACLPNCAEFLVIAWGALRAGLQFVPISSKLTATEIAYIVGDCQAFCLITSPAIGEPFADIPAMVGDVRLYAIEEADPPYESWIEAFSAQPTVFEASAPFGSEMFYSSGTTGRPKGVCWAEEADTGDVSPTGGLEVFGLGQDTMFLSLAPLYHSAPCRWSLGAVRGGGTTIIMEKFEPETALALIEEYGVNTTHWVPTHFVRMLKLPDEVRLGYDISSVRLVAHAAAPCPIEVKRQMIDWFGPIVLEYFGSTEQTAMTIITSEEWLARPGSVGKCYLGTLHICNDDGNEVPPGTIGTIYSKGGKKFKYHNDPEKTGESCNDQGWTTVGDVGYMDEDGYLFLTDRKGFMIISGGVNIYPQEIENLLVTHPRIYDAAVIGTPDPEMGEKVTAVIQPVEMADATPEFAEELRAWMRKTLSAVKIPKRIEFEEELPRLPTGKMQKFVLRERYS